MESLKTYTWFSAVYLNLTMQMLDFQELPHVWLVFFNKFENIIKSKLNKRFIRDNNGRSII